MHVVVHQHAGMQPAMKAGERNQQALQLALAILVIKEAGQPIVAPLHHVLGNAGEVGARKAGHAGSLATPAGSGDQRNAPPTVRNPP